MLPRIPLVEDVRDFWKFSKAGRQLAELHINYESIPAYKGVEVTGANTEFFRVEKMRFPKKSQKDKIIFNSKIQISNIPEKAYEYIVNGKSAIEWIMERYQITIHKDSGIKNDPNDWATEVGNPRYILDLLLSIINVSVQTVDIVNGLPKLVFDIENDESVSSWFDKTSEFIANQFGKDEKWDEINSSLCKVIEKNNNLFFDLTDLEKVAKDSNNDFSDIFSLVGLLSNPDKNILKLEYLSIDSDTKLDASTLHKKLREYWKEKKISEEDWEEWSRNIQIKWKINN